LSQSKVDSELLKWVVSNSRVL